MFRRLTLPVVFLGLAYGFWVSATFKDIAAGVAIFLFGMLCMEEGFKAFSGGTLERILRKGTEKTWKSLTFGIVTTTLMQSSSLVSVITISFISAGLLGLAEGIGIVFGANLGTTTGAWLVAGFGLKVNLSAYALPMLVFGVLLNFQQQRALKGAGWILIGFGFLFLGIHYMKEGFAGFADHLDLTQYALPGVIGLLTYTLFGIIATVIMQSSHATLVLIITALGAGQVTYENALALAIGSNVGTTITAVIGALSSSVEGKRLAGAHLIFNVGTGLLALLFIKWFMAAVEHISQSLGIPDNDYTLKLAVFHSLFNLVGVMLFTPFIGTLVRLLGRLLKSAKPLRDVPRYLSDASLDFPEVAVTALRRETQHLFNNAFSIIAHGINLRRADIRSDTDLQELLDKKSELIEVDIDQQYDLMVKDIYGANVVFYTQAAARSGAESAQRLQSLWQANLDIVAAIKATKHLRKNLNRYTRSPNLAIRREYNRFRVRIGELLRDIESLRDDSQETVGILSLDSLKVDLADSQRFTHRAVDGLIRDGAISAQMATSLMNDSRYVNEIMERLLSMAEGLLAASHAAEEFAPDLSLTPEEIEQVVDRLDEPRSTDAHKGRPS
ncbi:MAG: Na/Pi cotransporter family protein [Gammaproteobacteria bacterium]|nr:Na/Pi cotransporter family protein [Gammaproteobacteria bacterium]MCB1923289.1 Na/Pi cotransporter family protein [Gammaproteobacteria bacterium]